MIGFDGVPDGTSGSGVTTSTTVPTANGTSMRTGVETRPSGETRMAWMRTFGSTIGK